MLATSWKSTGRVRAVWQRLDVPKDKRGELARLTGIPATNLSAMNTGRKPTTLEAAARIAAAVPGVTVLDLGAPADADDEEAQSVIERLEVLEGLRDRRETQIRELQAFAEAVVARLDAIEAAQGLEAPLSVPQWSEPEL